MIIPKVSVIVPVYKVEKYIGRCIESVQKQTLSDWELILVDDAGGDKSMDIVKQYAATDERIRYIESKKNVGPMVAREKGYKASQGDYITFVDGDDTLVKTALEKMYSTAVENKADVVSANIVMVSYSGERKSFGNCQLEGCLDRKTVLEKMLTNEVRSNVCSKLFRGDLLRDNTINNYKGFRNGEDAFLFYQIMGFSNRISFIKDNVYEYWMNENSSTHISFTDETIYGLAMASKYRYSFFSNELEDIDSYFYKKLYESIYYVTMRCSYKKIEKIYRNVGLNIDLSLSNLMKYFPFFRAFKKYLVIHFYYQIKSLIH